MKYTVTTPYVDKYTGEEHAVGDKVEVTAERAKELKGYIKKTTSERAKKADN